MLRSARLVSRLSSTTSCCSIVRSFSASPSVTTVVRKASDANPIELEVGADQIRGVRIKSGLETSEKPRYKEYDSAFEQDPLPFKGQGPSDETYGEWGIDKEIPWFGDRRALIMWLCGFGFFGLVGFTAYNLAPARYASKRELLDNPQ